MARRSGSGGGVLVLAGLMLAGVKSCFSSCLPDTPATIAPSSLPAAATIADNTQAQRANDDELRRQRRDAEEAQLASYRAWTPQRRVTEIAQACPPRADRDCDTTRLERLARSGHDDAETGRLEKLVERAEAAHDRATAVRVSAPAKKEPDEPMTTVKCCDGTFSPSCTCGRASYQGCCSHHGGICKRC